MDELKAKLEKAEAENAKLKGALLKAAKLAEWDNWPTRHPLVFGAMSAALEGE
jgi:hypothetical protein